MRGDEEIEPCECFLKRCGFLLVLFLRLLVQRKWALELGSPECKCLPFCSAATDSEQVTSSFWTSVFSSVKRITITPVAHKPVSRNTGDNTSEIPSSLHAQQALHEIMIFTVLGNIRGALTA